MVLLSHQRILFFWIIFFSLNLLLVQATDGGKDNTNSKAIVGNGFIVAAGLAVCFLGYVILKSTVFFFLCGFIGGGVFFTGFVRCFITESTTSNTTWWLAFILGGLLVALLAFCMEQKGIFFIGACAGTLLAYTLNTCFAFCITPSHPHTFLMILMIGLGALGGLLVLRKGKISLFFATSFVGAYLSIWGLSMFISGREIHDPNTDKHEDFDEIWRHTLAPGWWIYMTLMVLLTLTGAYVQYKKTSQLTLKSKGSVDSAVSRNVQN